VEASRMLIAVIGGAGKMGAWFARYFLEHGHEVIISDIKVDKAGEIAKSMNVKMAASNVEAAKRADLILISTPIDVTPKVLVEIAPELSECTVLAEISSLKSRIIPVLKNIAKRGVKTLSLHPLFGSGARGIVGEKIALIPVIDPLLEEELAKKIFPEAKIILVDCDLHDRIMALTLALTHFINIVFASIIGEENINVLKRLGGTTFTLQAVISEAVMCEDPALYASIQMDNEYTIKYLDKFMLKADKLRSIIKEKDFNAFTEIYSEVRGMLSRDEDFEKAYERMYRALKAI
jgi:prephenate dehydrogenase